MACLLRTHRGRVLFQRRGTLTPVKQDYWVRAPAREGLWAFPWPHFSGFFTAHQFEAIKPGRLKRDGDGDGAPMPFSLEEYNHWYEKVAPRVLPIRRFWYDGELFTHVDGRGSDLGLDRWERVPAIDFAERAARYLVQASFFVHGGKRLQRRPNTMDAETLEVFIPTRFGRFEPTPVQRLCGGQRAR